MSADGRSFALDLGAELLVDSFAGGGGASTGIEMALGRPVDVAINHDGEALQMHAINHPHTLHVREDVFAVDAERVMGDRQIGLLWASPDCKHHSKAKGGKPVEKHIRGLAWVVCKWAQRLKPRIIALENVEEFRQWGPLKQIDGEWFPDPDRKGETFQRFVARLRALGYKAEWKELRACDYGAPTIRKRLFVVARRDGRPIVWPTPTHGPGLKPYRTAAECIDWSIPCPSIFERKRPLAEATLRRIARGIKRYVIDAPSPFIVPVLHGAGDTRSHGIDEPLRTITGAQRGDRAVVVPQLAPFITEHANASNQRSMPADEPLRTQCAQVKGGHFAVVVPHITKFRTGSTGHAADEPLHTICAGGEMKRDAGAAHAMGLVSACLVPRYGEREGQEPRCRSIEEPAPVVVPTGNGAGLVTAFLAKHFGGHETPGASLENPVSTVTAQDHHALVTSNLVKLSENSVGQDVREPLHTVMAGASRFAEVRAFLLRYYSEGGQWGALDEPMHTIPTKDRIGLVMVHGEPYQIVDIGMRMLSPRELARAQGFPDSYVIERGADGKPLSKTAQVRMIGNSVCPPMAAAIVRANFQHEVRIGLKAA